MRHADGQQYSHEPLIQIVEAAVADAYRRGGSHLLCHPGCSQCCIGVFPIAHEDGARLHEGLAILETTDPQKAALAFLLAKGGMN